MGAFFSYIRDSFTEFWRNFVEWLKLVFADPWVLVVGDIKEYVGVFNRYVNNFGAGGWVFYILMLLIIVALIGALGYLVFIGIRGLVRLGKKQFEKTRLIGEVQRLNKELFYAIQEKNEVLKLKAESLGLDDPNL